MAKRKLSERQLEFLRDRFDREMRQEIKRYNEEIDCLLYENGLMTPEEEIEYRNRLPQCFELEDDDDFLVIGNEIKR